jgi:hypothetical protein
MRKSVRQHLNRFAIATTLAVGLLALAWPVAAQIVYTPVNITITQGKYKLDLNNDGATDFTIAVQGRLQKTECGLTTHYIVEETPSSDNGAESSSPAELVAGDPIGPSQTFYAGRGILLSNHENCRGKSRSKGNWVIGAPGYLGLSFQLNGEIFYGWAHLTISGYLGGFVEATLTGYAYEGTPGMPINAGQTQ